MNGSFKRIKIGNSSSLLLRTRNKKNIIISCSVYVDGTKGDHGNLVHFKNETFLVWWEKESKANAISNFDLYLSILSNRILRGKGLISIYRSNVRISRKFNSSRKLSDRNAKPPLQRTRCVEFDINCNSNDNWWKHACLRFGKMKLVLAI